MPIRVKSPRLFLQVLLHLLSKQDSQESQQSPFRVEPYAFAYYLTIPWGLLLEDKSLSKMEEIYSTQFSNFQLANDRYIFLYVQSIMNSSTEVVKAGITVFLVIAVAGSIFQEINFGGSTKPVETQAAVADVPVNGTKVDGLVILSTQKFRKEFRDILAEKEYSVQIKEYPFEGQEYWMNAFLTHGHMLVVFFLVSKYQSEQDQGRKTKIMIGGMLLVFIWMMGTPYLRTQRLGLQYKGQKVYQKDSFDHKQIAAKLEQYDELSAFDMDPPVVSLENKPDITYSQTEPQIPDQIHEDF